MVNPENLPRIGGYVCLIIGLYLTRVQLKRFFNKQPEKKSAFEFRLLFYGVVFLGLGIFLVLKKL